MILESLKLLFFICPLLKVDFIQVTWYGKSGAGQVNCKRIFNCKKTKEECTMTSKITNLKNVALSLIALLYSSQLYAEVHPVMFKYDTDLYSKTYFGMNFN